MTFDEEASSRFELDGVRCGFESDEETTVTQLRWSVGVEEQVLVVVARVSAQNLRFVVVSFVATVMRTTRALYRLHHSPQDHFAAAAAVMLLLVFIETARSFVVLIIIIVVDVFVLLWRCHLLFLFFIQSHVSRLADILVAATKPDA